jgi:DnaJ-class molecular chaperone
MPKIRESIPCPSCSGVGREGKNRECDDCEGTGVITLDLSSAGLAVVAVFYADQGGRRLRLT